jgi:hypothetical protein
LSSGQEGVLGLGTSAFYSSSSSNPDAWAIKFIDAMWIQPILEAIDDDASGFINITEVNEFTSSRPVEWRSVSHHFRPIRSDESQFAALDSFLGCG